MAISIINLNVSNPTGILYEKYELNFDVSGLASSLNPFDPNEIDISVVFTGPYRLSKTVNAFWAGDFLRNDTAPDPTQYYTDCYSSKYLIVDVAYLTPKTTLAPWHVRFCPDETGYWTYYFIVKTGGSSITLAGGNFVVSDNLNELNRKGFIIAVGRNFGYNNGNIFLPVGVNSVTKGTAVYNRYNYLYVKDAIDEVAANKGNYLRIFLGSGFFGVEWGINGLNNYAPHQNRAFDLDALLEHAHAKGVYLQLCLQDYAQYNTLESMNWDIDCLPGTWAENPYGTIKGVNTGMDFFENEVAKEVYKKNLRYIIARWGYSTKVFAFEFFNEIDKIAGNHFWDNPGPGSMLYWLNEMRRYCKITLADRHLYTVSFANPASTGSFYGGLPATFGELMQMDFYSDHFYTDTVMNQDHQINFLANKAKAQYKDKPYLLGEFGKNPDCYVWTQSFRSGKIYEAVEYHDSLWASILSGCSGSAMYWETGLLTWCSKGQLQNILPLIKFLEGEAINLSKYFAITNRCAEVTCNPSPQKGPPLGLPPGATLNDTVVTNDDGNVEVFALKHRVDNKILGWVKNKNNYFFNLPHDVAPNGSVDCSSLHNPTPSVPSLSGIKITINDLKCDAIYAIDFYGTYPKQRLNAGEEPVDGGIIRSFSIARGSNCGSLTFEVPPLIALQPQATEVPFTAPDYGFKIRILTKLWGHLTIGPQPTIQPFALGQGQIAYRGAGGRINCFYRDSGAFIWHNVVISPDGVRAVKSNGAVARGRLSGQVYYHGEDDRLQCVYWGGSTWLHTYLGPADRSQNVGGDIISNEIGGRVFYRGIDGKLHHYYYSSGWKHTVLYIWSFDLVAAGSNLAVNADGGIVAYKAIDGKLHIFYKGGSTWYHDYSPADAVGGTIRMNNAGDVIFYAGTDGKLHEYYYYGTSWHSRVVAIDGWPVHVDGPFDITPDCTYDNAQIYLRGWDGHIQVVYAYGGKWVISYLVCTKFLRASSKCKKGSEIRYADGMVVYDAVSGNMEAYYFGHCGD